MLNLDNQSDDFLAIINNLTCILEGTRALLFCCNFPVNVNGFNLQKATTFRYFAYEAQRLSGGHCRRHVPYNISTTVRLKRSWRARRHSLPSHSRTGLRSSMNTFSESCFYKCRGEASSRGKLETQRPVNEKNLYLTCDIDIRGF